MIIFAFFFAPVVLYCLWHFLHSHEMNVVEFFAQIGITGAVIALAVLLANYSSVSDSGMVVGRVTAKDYRDNSCNTYWSDYRSSGCDWYDTRSVLDGSTCTTVDKKTTCRPKYKTQYRYWYSFERDWIVHGKSVVGKASHDVGRGDRQGLVSSKVWNVAKIGEPFAMDYSYNNYIGAAANSLFHKDIAEVEGISYPAITNYYRTKLAADPVLDEKLQNISADTGELVLYIKAPDSSGPEYAEQIAKTLRGHKLYDIVVVSNGSWVDVRSWSKNSLVNIALRDHIYANMNDWANPVATEIIKLSYGKPDPEDFSYLYNEIEFPTWGYILLTIILLITPFATHLLLNNEVRK